MPTASNKWNTDFGSTRSHRRIIGKVLGLLQQNGSSYILSFSELTPRIPRTDVSTCVVPPTLSSYGDRTFTAAGPRLWNSLPVQLRNPDITYGLFRRQLKVDTFFGKHEHGALWLLICGAMEKHLLTYLLLTDTSEHICFYFLVLLFFYCVVVGSVR